MTQDDISGYLPLTETTYYILLALIEPLHGYAVIKKIQKISEGTVNVGAGTLYNAVSKLQQEGLIVKVNEDDRRKFYRLSQKGKLVLKSQIARLETMLKRAQIVQG
jgi:DNA-binding PadR family transcriptional regulator